MIPLISRRMQIETGDDEFSQNSLYLDHDEVTTETVKYRFCIRPRISTHSGNFYFLTASFLYLINGIMDLANQIELKNTDDDDDDLYADDKVDDDDVDPLIDLGNGFIYVTPYQMIYTAAAFFFVLNAIVDWKSAEFDDDFDLDTHDESSCLDNIWGRNGRLSLEKCVAFLLGCGAVFDMLAAIFVETYDFESSLLGFFAACFFLCEAIVAITIRYFPSILYFEYRNFSIRSVATNTSAFSISSFSTDTGNIKKNLSFVGDILFFIGSLIDFLIGCLEFSPIASKTVTLAGWEITSDILWLIDAMLYILKDSL